MQRHVVQIILSKQILCSEYVGTRIVPIGKVFVVIGS